MLQFGTLTCYIISFVIEYKVLKENININLKVSKYLIKPIIASIMMGISSYYVYVMLNNFLMEKISIIITLIFAIIIYITVVLCLGILSKEEICSMPNGKKLYIFLNKYKLC